MTPADLRDLRERSDAMIARHRGLLREAKAAVERIDGQLAECELVRELLEHGPGVAGVARQALSAMAPETPPAKRAEMLREWSETLCGARLLASSKRRAG